MKFILPVVCSILFIGCGNPIQTSAPVTDTPVIESQTAIAPILPEAVAPIPTSAPVSISKPESSKTSVPAPATVTAAAIDGNTLFVQKCASCHGMKGEKSALGKSQIIADLTEQQIKDALHGYQDGSYGKEMKGLMQGQVKALSSESITALAKHISTL